MSDQLNKTVIKYEINDFRSLIDFRIELSEGLNILLGTNGSGKTNFIEFLDFISSFIRDGGSNAVSSLGGVSRVFSQEALGRKIPRVRAKIFGTADCKIFVDSKSDRTRFHFEYELDFRFSKRASTLYIAHECIKFKNLHWENLDKESDITVGSLRITRPNPLSESPPNWKVGSYLTSKASRNPLKFNNRIFLRKSSKGREEHPLLSMPRSGIDESILQSLRGFPAVDAVRFELSRRRSFNLVPKLARSADDLSKPPGIESDGSGLSATLFHMQRISHSEASLSPYAMRRNFDKNSLKTVIAWTRLVVPELEGIICVSDPHTGKYLATMLVNSLDGILKIPLQSASDGTLKWLAFVCLIVGSKSSFTFEEPENFLHPKMQTFLVSLIRENMEYEQGSDPIIFSTHSESLINSCKPEELILFRFEDGKTVCSRIQKPDRVRQEINRTGFGLGYYYAANAVT